MSRPPKRCIYCGATGVTKEHLWGSWSRKLARATFPATEHIVTRFVAGEISPALVAPGPLTRAGSPRSLTLKVVCRACNNGWMKENVDAAIPLLKRLHDGIWWNLLDEERTVLAVWAIQLTCTWEWADRDTIAVPQKERNHLRMYHTPSPYWAVFAGRFSSLTNNDYVFHRRLDLSPTSALNCYPRSQITTITFGDLIMQTYYGEAGFPFNPDAYPRSLGLHPLWPLSNAPIGTPVTIHGDHTFMDVATRLSEALMTASLAGWDFAESDLE